MYFLVPCRNNKALLMQTLGPTPGSQVCIGWDACQTLYNPTCKLALQVILKSGLIVRSYKITPYRQTTYKIVLVNP